MGRYRKCKNVRVDVVRASGIMPFGAFLKDGGLTAGWSYYNTFSDALPNVTSLCLSRVGNRIIGGTSSGQVFTCNPGDGTEITQLYTDGNDSPFVFETYERRK